ncbi:MAG: response regulator transcription factor [Clostridia bacterium]|nr:response regulator transcription factor [Clostridia bacterium]
MIRILLVDDQKEFTNTLKLILEQDSEFKIEGCARNGIEALELCRKYLPDIVLMDLGMPLCDGVEATKLIKKEFKWIKILVLTTFANDFNIKNAISSGADGYILKEMDAKKLIVAVKGVAYDLGVMNKSVYNSILPTENIKLDIEELGLGRKEIDIIQMVVNGKNNKDIATALYFSEGTVKNTITLILKKLNLKDRTQLAIFAINHKLV